MTGRDRRQPRTTAPTPRQPRRAGNRVERGIFPVLAKAVRDVELAVQRGRVGPSTRSAFQAVALLVREERTRIQSDDVSEAARAEQLKRVDRIATALARTAARDGSLLTLLTEDAEVPHETRSLLREMRHAAGIEPPP